MGKKFVSVYEVTRHFGGHEEGGWWYDKYECLETVPTKKENVETVTKHLEKEYSHMEHGDIGHVNGGVKIVVLDGDKPCEHEKLDKPLWT